MPVVVSGRPRDRGSVRPAERRSRRSARPTSRGASPGRRALPTGRRGGGPGYEFVPQIIWRGVEAQVLAHDGRCDRAEAVAVAEPTDLLALRGDVMLDLAAVRHCCGRADEARQALLTALGVNERKDATVPAARRRALIGAPAPEADPAP
jgi:hypothetical protein